MSKRFNFFKAITDRNDISVWTRRAKAAPKMREKILRIRRRRARALIVQLNQFLQIADDRLSIPRIGARMFKKGRGVDFSWRASFWRWPSPLIGAAGAPTGHALRQSLHLFHNCPDSEITVRQLRNLREQDLAPFGLSLDVMEFRGSFLSIAQDLPQQAITGLKTNHLVRLNTIVEFESPIKIFARLNIEHGPNTAQLTREIPLENTDVWVEFDLGELDLNENRIEKMWVDLIFEEPRLNKIIIRDLTFSRSPRAEL